MPIKSLTSLSAFRPFNLLLQNYHLVNLTNNPDVVVAPVLDQETREKIQLALEYLCLKLVMDPEADKKYKNLREETKARVNDVIDRAKLVIGSLPEETELDLRKAHQASLQAFNEINRIINQLNCKEPFFFKISAGALSVAETLGEIVRIAIHKKKFKCAIRSRLFFI